MLITRLLASRIFLLIITLIITGIVAFLMLHELHLLMSEISRETLLELKEDEEGIAILLVGFGVLLEGRHILQNWIARAEVEETYITYHCEYYGFMLLALGLIVEMFYQLTKIIDIPTLTYWTEILINYPINIYALVILVKVILVLLDKEGDNKPAPH